MTFSGSLEDWNGSRCDSDQGFSEDALTLKQDPLMPPKVTAAAGRKTGFAKKAEAEECSAEAPRLTLQQVRVALQKIPAAQLRSPRRRRHSTTTDEAAAVHPDKKRIKMEENMIGADPGKITAYMPETKAAKAAKAKAAACCLRKQRKDKLDLILNLKSEQPRLDSNDLFLVSRLKELNNCSTDGVKTEAVPVQCDLKTEKNLNQGGERVLFEAPRSPKPPPQQQEQQPPPTIRFPKPLSPPAPEAAGVECRWEGCKETALESNGKLLDHLKVRHLTFTMSLKCERAYLNKNNYKAELKSGHQVVKIVR